ncbi:flagellar hook-length control protein FliK [Shewanella goraebulensis]|uniref:flagellar hook-length control protein FliK n=1 Tax=Shewanella goraebulensis TaxID=3050637 RepID=UPI0025501955|nr:flagellar hook-length control protein FliK [Shewanella goraebulensis]
MITNTLSLTSVGTSSQQPFRSLEAENGEQGVIGFVMPESQTTPTNLTKTASSQTAAMPEHILAELKQHPQLFNALSEYSNLLSKPETGISQSSITQAQLPLGELRLSNLIAADAKPLSSELMAMLANLTQQASSVNSQQNNAVLHSRFNPQSTTVQPQGALSAPAMPSSLPAVDMQTAQTQIPSVLNAQAGFQPVIADAASTELDNINQVINQLTQANTKSQAVTQWGPVSVTQSAPMLQQTNEMMSPLRDQLRFQIDQQIKSAELRLDPPELGKVELNIRLDGDRLHIQMHAANSAVRDALLMGLDRLRMELAMDHGGQIDIDMGQSQSEQQPQRQQVSSAQSSNIEFQASEQHQATELKQQDQVDLLA